MTKKVLSTLAIIIAILAIFPATSRTSKIYELDCIILNVDKEADEVLCEDSNGQLWSFYGADLWKIGDKCVLHMSDNKTENITDDVIMGIDYNGHIS